MEEVILVDEQDVEIGTLEKMEAHIQGKLHRAFSIFIFNEKGEMLLQQRATEKYHSGGLWTNACCSHPRPGETIEDASNRRLIEEMGFSTPLTKIFDFKYKASFENGLTEHEFDHVFKGIYSDTIIPDVNEVKDFKFLPLQEIKSSIQLHPEKYTAWFCIAFSKIEEWLILQNQDGRLPAI
jgi:isopentenyl-diphosphate Delta-isomerase